MEVESRSSYSLAALVPELCALGSWDHQDLVALTLGGKSSLASSRAFAALDRARGEPREGNSLGTRRNGRGADIAFV